MLRRKSIIADGKIVRACGDFKKDIMNYALLLESIQNFVGD